MNEQLHDNPLDNKRQQTTYRRAGAGARRADKRCGGRDEGGRRAGTGGALTDGGRVRGAAGLSRGDDVALCVCIR